MAALDFHIFPIVDDSVQIADDKNSSKIRILLIYKDINPLPQGFINLISPAFAEQMIL